MSDRAALSVFAAAREAPERIALITAQRCITYTELAALVRGRAASLGNFPQVLLLQPQLDLDSLLWLYAAMATGTPFVALSTQASASELARAQALTRSQRPPKFVAGSGTPILDPRRIQDPRPIPDPPWNDTVGTDPRAPFSLLLTSGSSGTPKLVVSSRAAVMASAAASAGNLGVEDEDRWLLCLALSHVAGLAIVVRMLIARRTVVLFDAAPTGSMARVGELGRRIHEQRVSLVSLVPTLLERLLTSGFRAPPTLRAVLLGGAACSAPLADRSQRAGVPLITSYGLTETGSQILARHYEERHSPLPRQHGGVSSGHPLAGVEIKLLAGRIAVKSPSLLSAYLGADTPALDAQGWFLTNDRGEWGPQGELYVVGRTDSMIISGAENVDPEEVERALRQLPQVLDACIMGLPSPQYGQSLLAVVVLAPDVPSMTLEFLRRALRTQLAGFQLPRALLIAGELPLTSSGKLDRPACARQFAPLFDASASDWSESAPANDRRHSARSAEASGRAPASLSTTRADT